MGISSSEVVTVMLSIAVLVISVVSALDMPYSPYPRGRNLQFEEDAAGVKLNLTPYIKSNRIAEGRDLSLVTGLTPNITSYAGFFTVAENCDSALFFWFFPSQNKPESDPVSVWLQGGPGSSSFFGLLTENGPYNLGNDGKLELREFSWNRNSSMIFIDNPVGTGYSYTQKGCYVTNESEVGRDLLNALEQFFQVFPEYSQNPFFLTGESYAGKYIPAAAYAIMKANSSINLQGIMIGNGLVDPRYQHEYSSLFYQLGLIDIDVSEDIAALEEQYRNAIDAEDYATAQYYSTLVSDRVMTASDLYSIYNFLYNEGSVPKPDFESFVTKLDFFQVFPEYSQNPFFLTGESYAGKYIPAAAYAIMKASSIINLQGIMIGNGLIDPRYQKEFSSSFYQLGLIDISVKEDIAAIEEKHRNAIDAEDYATADNYSILALHRGRTESGINSVYNFLYNSGSRPVLNIDSFVTRLDII